MNNSNKCSVENCKEEMEALNLCKKHYKLINGEKIPLIFIFKCCSMGSTRFKEFLDTERELGRIYKIERNNLFNTIEKKLDKLYGIDVKDLDDSAYIVLPNTNEIIQIEVLKNV